MNAPTPLAHYQAMAEQAQRDNRATGADSANETSARGPGRDATPLATVLHAYPYLGLHLQAFGQFSEDGKCKIRKVQAFGDQANLYSLIPPDVIDKMAIEAEQCADYIRQRAQYTAPALTPYRDPSPRCIEANAMIAERAK